MTGKARFIISTIAVLSTLTFVSQTSRAQGRGTYVVLAGTGEAGYCDGCNPATTAPLNRPTQITVDMVGYVFFTDRANNRVRKLTREGVLQTVAEIDDPVGIALDADANLYVSSVKNGTIYRIDGLTAEVAPLASGFTDPFGLAVDAENNVYVSDSSFHQVFKVTQEGVKTAYAGTGQAGFSGDGGKASAARLNHPAGLAFDTAGNLYIADSENGRVRKVTPEGIISTIAGDGSIPPHATEGGPATQSTLVNPQSVTVDSRGYLFIAETDHRRIRRVTPAGNMRVVADREASGIFVDVRGNLLMANEASQQVSKIYKEGCGGGIYAGQVATLTSNQANVAVGGQSTYGVQLDPCLEDASFTVTDWAVEGGIGTLVANSPSPLETPSALFTSTQTGDGEILATVHLAGDSTDYPISVPISVVPFVQGDVNVDGKVTVADAILLLQIAVGSIPSTPETVRVGDWNHDNKILIGDVVVTLRTSVGLNT